MFYVRGFPRGLGILGCVGTKTLETLSKQGGLTGEASAVSIFRSLLSGRGKGMAASVLGVERRKRAGLCTQHT